MNDKYKIDLDVRQDFISLIICKRRGGSWFNTYADISATNEFEAKSVWRMEGDPDFPEFDVGETRHWRDAYQGASEMLKIAKRFIEWDAARQ